MRNSNIPLPLFVIIFFFMPCLFVAVSRAQGFDFFYLVQQWPGSFCDTRRGCCYPTAGKPAADFGIHGFWPNYNDGSYPSNCDADSPFDEDQVRELRRELQSEWPTLACPSGSGLTFWEHEWEKHGTCSESVLGQRAYFRAALDLKNQFNLLQILKDAGIEPDDGFYSLSRISNAISEATGHVPGIECNVDAEGNRQLYQVYMCVDTSGTRFIECPILPRSKCSSRQIQFPSFGGDRDDPQPQTKTEL